MLSLWPDVEKLLKEKKKKKERVVRITDLKGEQGFCVIKIATVSMEDSRDVWDYL